MSLESYDFKETEKKFIEDWHTTGVYKWDPTEPREKTFVVDTPPPTVSGSLHIGHIFSYTHTDIIVRFQRMSGKNIFYPIGFDDNGLPTERLVEKKKGVRATNMARHEFVELCKEVIEEEEQKFRQLFESIGFSFDWALEYRTISDHTRKISQFSFLDLVEKKQIYRADQPMLWDCIDQTALAQAEVEDKEFESHMNELVFEVEGGEKIVIATTRPELLPACVAVFCHPDDSRYKNLVGKHAVTPLFEAKVPILFDNKVDPDKGTGLVMCCTFGDMTDVFWWKKHSLPLKVIISKQGRIISGGFKDSRNQDSAKFFFSQIENLKIKEARSKIIEILKEQGILIKQIPVVQTVKCAERSGAPLEILSTPQWFVKTLEHKSAMLEASAKLNWHPKHMKIRLDSWIESIAWDWCISRQRFFGVPIPIWYSKRAGEEGKILFANPADLPIDPLKDLPHGYSREEVEPDPDVFDTWATSAVSPQINSYAINEKFFIDLERHNKLFPADLRPQAHEIIRVWAFCTILKSYLHQNTLPWHNIMISGWCLAHDKSKMSKSKGNVITPEGLIEKYGADVIRYWASTARLGADTAYSEDIMNNGKRFVNKLWNASKFASANFHAIENNPLDLHQLIINESIFCSVDLWVISKLKSAVKEVTTALDKFEYSIAREIIELFFWKDFCDNYLEIVKTRSYNSAGEDQLGQKSAVYTLYWGLNIVLKLVAPFMPFVTEEIYTTLFEDKSIHRRGTWIRLEDINISASCFREGVTIVEILENIRKYKADRQISIKAPIKTLHVRSPQEIKASTILDLKNVSNAEEIIYECANGSELNIEIL